MSSRPTRSASQPMLIGVSAGATLFALTLCTVAMFFLPTFSAQWASTTQPGPSWTPPPPTATPSSLTAPLPTKTHTPPTPTIEVGSETTTSSNSDFQAGDVVTNVNNGPVNMRQTPGYLGKPNSDRIGLVPSRSQLRIVAGPKPKDGLTWWQVQWQDKTGWMAERTASGVLILELAE